MEVGNPNPESDADLKIRAMNYVLDRICSRYKEKADPTFTSEEIKARLKGLGPKYVDLNIRDIFKGSGYVEIDDSYNLILNERGKQACKRGELSV